MKSIEDWIFLLDYSWYSDPPTLEDEADLDGLLNRLNPNIVWEVLTNLKPSKQALCESRLREFATTKKWKLPDWHEDWGDSEALIIEMESLRECVVRVAYEMPTVIAKLVVMEPGYMYVAFIFAQKTVADLIYRDQPLRRSRPQQTNNNETYGLFAGDHYTGKNSEIYFSDPYLLPTLLDEYLY